MDDFLRSFTAADLTEVMLDLFDLDEPIEDDDVFRARLTVVGDNGVALGGRTLRGGSRDDGFGNLGGVFIILGGGDIISIMK